MRNFAKWNFLVFICIQFYVTKGAMTFNQYKYLGYRNTWQEGTHHISYNLTTPDTPKKVEMTCANYCTLDTLCNGFYVANTPEGNCHIVRLSEETNKNITTGFGQMEYSRVYFVKTEISAPMVASQPPTLAQPCTTDATIPLTPAQCNATTANETTYYTCSASNINYLGTLGSVSDAVCLNETRLLQCNLTNGFANSNINPATRFDILNPGFLRYIYSTSGIVSIPGDELTFVSGGFTPAKSLTRFIVRVADPNVDKIQSFSFTVSSAANNASVTLTLPSINTCAVGYVFAKASNPTMATAAKQAEGFRLDILSKFSTSLGNVGFKIDLFYLT